MAANFGSYTNSACGPSVRPEQEVANLVRLEPDNAAAWQFAVALASAIGDQAGWTMALSRMAAATRADDHLVAQVEEWTKAYTAQPEPAFLSMRSHASAKPSSEAVALLSALQKVDGGYHRLTR